MTKLTNVPVSYRWKNRTETLLTLYGFEPSKQTPELRLLVELADEYDGANIGCAMPRTAADRRTHRDTVAGWFTRTCNEIVAGHHDEHAPDTIAALFVDGFLTYNNARTFKLWDGSGRTVYEVRPTRKAMDLWREWDAILALIGLDKARLTAYRESWRTRKAMDALTDANDAAEADLDLLHPFSWSPRRAADACAEAQRAWHLLAMQAMDFDKVAASLSL